MMARNMGETPQCPGPRCMAWIGLQCSVCYIQRYSQYTIQENRPLGRLNLALRAFRACLRALSCPLQIPLVFLGLWLWCCQFGVFIVRPRPTVLVYYTAG